MILGLIPSRLNSKRLKSIAIVCGLAPNKVKGMNEGRVGMLMNYGNRPIICKRFDRSITS